GAPPAGEPKPGAAPMSTESEKKEASEEMRPSPGAEAGEAPQTEAKAEMPGDSETAAPSKDVAGEEVFTGTDGKEGTPMKSPAPEGDAAADAMKSGESAAGKGEASDAEAAEAPEGDSMKKEEGTPGAAVPGSGASGDEEEAPQRSSIWNFFRRLFGGGEGE
ncbi:MAG: hypothetical protein AAF191_18495, partial [Verrucomicrobiota bacterium]